LAGAAEPEKNKDRMRGYGDSVVTRGSEEEKKSYKSGTHSEQFWGERRSYLFLNTVFPPGEGKSPFRENGGIKGKRRYSAIKL